MRTYKLQPEPHYSIYTGRSPDDLQYIICSVGGSLLVAEFSADGELKKTIVEKSDQPMNKKISESMTESWLNRLNIKLQTVEVKKFKIKEPGLEIRDLPSELEDFLYDENFVLEQDKEEYERDIQDWTERQDYVLLFGKGLPNFWVDKEGLITDS